MEATETWFGVTGVFTRQRVIRDEILLFTSVAEKMEDGEHLQSFMWVVQFMEDGLNPLLQQEIGYRSPSGGALVNPVKLLRAKKGKPGGLKLSAGKQKMSMEAYIDLDEGFEITYEQMLLPWLGEKKLIYRYDSGHLFRE